MEIWHVLFWAVVTVVLILAELGTIQLIAIWFAAGSLVAFISSILNASFMMQIILFLAVSIVLLLLTRPLIKKFLTDRKIPTNADSIVGQRGYVYEPIDNLHQRGRIKVNGLEWAAKSEDDSITFEEDDLCIVVAIEGVKAIVIPIYE